ncbi:MULTISPECIES: hypothetical protein [Streptomyces]|uniref:Uncharacterized protein n=1 Tax=Streptomyces evansiae TaxID=3075535 RepID=A0ABU2R8U7_9ACTN|nr:MULTISPECIES: hypothetical protein [unclassified Streptomyces]MDT0412743.1 hypothetical protein [Streptomyces sp. DSM 41979]MYQ56437.1 hypothetical protein [Streptomyces sp. SID4926]
MAEPPSRGLPTLAVPARAVPPPPVPALPDEPADETAVAVRSEGLPAVVEDGSEARPGMREGLGGAMVLAAGVAVTIVRGMSQWLGDRRTRFEERAGVREAVAKARADRIRSRAEHAASLAQIAHGAAEARAKDAAKNRGTFGGGRSGGSGTGGSSGGGSGKGRTSTGSGSAGLSPKPKRAPAGRDASARHGAGGKGGHAPGGRTKDVKPKPDRASGRGVKSPLGPKSSHQSPALERTRGRQERAAARQRAKAERRADQHAQRMKQKAAGVDRASKSKGARQDAKDRAKVARIKAQGERKQRIRDGRQAAKDKARDAKRQRRREEKEARTLLGDALAKTAGKRLRKRRKSLAPPIISKTGKKRRKEKPAPPPPRGVLDKVVKDTPKPPPTMPRAGAAKKKSAGGRRRKWSFRKVFRKRPKKNTGATTGPGSAGTAPGSPGSRSRRTREQQAPPRDAPRPDGEWLRPPPGMAATYTVTLERLDQEEAAARPSSPAALAPPRAALPSAPPPQPAQGSPAPPPANPSAPGGVPAPRKEARPMPGAPVPATASSGGPVESVQFPGQSDLTVYDLIESDEDGAEEILAGAEHARMVANRCQRLQESLEALAATLTDKRVPGVLLGWCTRLIDRAGEVEAKADALAAKLPGASEALKQAGSLAAEYDQHPADVTRDMGHAAPADRTYHQE